MKNARDPYKGGLRFHPGLDADHAAAAGLKRADAATGVVTLIQRFGITQVLGIVYRAISGHLIRRLSPGGRGPPAVRARPGPEH